MKRLDQESYRLIAEAVHQATGGKIPNNHPAYLWVRENLAPSGETPVGVSMHGYSTPQYPVSISHLTQHGELYNPMHFKSEEDARRWLKHYEPGVVVLIGRRFAVVAD